jgi:NMT1/THI5 like
MHIRHRPFFLLSISLLFILLSVMLAACGGGSSSGSVGSSTSTACKTANHTTGVLGHTTAATQLASFSEGFRQTASATTTLKDVSIGLGYIPNIQFAPFYVAQSKGYYQAAGLNVTFHHGFVNDLIGSMVVGHDNFVFASGSEQKSAGS